MSAIADTVALGVCVSAGMTLILQYYFVLYYELLLIYFRIHFPGFFFFLLMKVIKGLPQLFYY